MSNTSISLAFGGGSAASSPKPIQSGQITIPGGAVTGYATISAVVPSKTRLRPVGTRTAANTFPAALATLSFASSTSIQALRATADDGALVVAWEAEEWS